MNKAIIKLSYDCNNNCLFCHSKPKNKLEVISVNKVFKKILILKNKGIKAIYLSGGEPLLNKDIKKIIRFIKNNNLLFGLISNSRMLLYEDQVRELKNDGLIYVHTTILGPKKIHDEITKAQFSFDQTIKGIKNLLKNKIDFDINYVVVKQNADYMKETTIFLKKLGVKKIKFSFVEPNTKNDTHIPKISDVSKHINKILKEVSDINIVFDNLPMCLSKEFEEKRENLLTKKILFISEAYENAIYRSDEGIKVKTNKCDGCTKKKNCEGIFKNYLELYGDKELIPFN